MLDTDVCVHLLNRRYAYDHIIQRMHGRDYGQIVISAVTYAELQYGNARSQREIENTKALNLFLERFEISSFDQQAASIYGALRRSLLETEQTIDPLDMLIAAHALSDNCCLVTHNVQEFSRIEDLVIKDRIADGRN